MLQFSNLSVTQDDKGVNLEDAPAVKPFMIRDTSGSPRHVPRNCRSVIGVLNYLSGSTRPVICCTLHQVSHVCAEAKQSYENM